MRTQCSSLLVVAGLALTPLAPFTLAFDSGSDGSDGALSFAPDAGTVVFDPRSYDPPLDPDGDNVYHFTTVTIPAGVRVKLWAYKLNWAPVYWLTTDATVIDGILDMSGGGGFPRGYANERRWSHPGPGGYPGGVGGAPGVDCGNGVGCGQDGFGPGGGVRVGGGGHGAYQSYTNHFLLPLLGGSGGNGEDAGGAGFGAGGGAGAGAILIASTVSIHVNGEIRARGGSAGGPDPIGSDAGYGSGGGIRLLAPLIGGTGKLDTSAIWTYHTSGRVRLEAARRTFTGTVLGAGEWRVVALPPNPVFLPPPRPRLRVTTLDGQNIPLLPGGTFAPADVAVNTGDPVTLNIEASNIAVGTSVTLTIHSEQGNAQTVTSTPLAGTIEQSTATATATFPVGFSQVFITATWN